MTALFPALWKELYKKAQDRSALGMGGGMASFNLKYNPYECKWAMKVDWSDNVSVTGEGGDEDIAVTHCIKSLDSLLARERQQKERS